ncbi:MAG: hypothetical protein ABI891_08310 [Acidobacteriota bacterium]
MSNHDKQKLSAQVILRPADGKGAIPPENITSENVHQIMPSAENVKNARKFCVAAGFEVDAGFANSFSITGDVELFEKTFKTKISQNEKQAVKAVGENDTESSELPLGNLPQEIKKIVETITFTEPPDFGPGNF